MSVQRIYLGRPNCLGETFIEWDTSDLTKIDVSCDDGSGTAWCAVTDDQLLDLENMCATLRAMRRGSEGAS